MKMNKLLSKISCAALLALTTSVVFAVPDQPKEWEKCDGISKAGKNDCGVKGKHECAGQGKAGEWVYVPKGTCDKVAGGKVIGIKPAKK